MLLSCSCAIVCVYVCLCACVPPQVILFGFSTSDRLSGVALQLLAYEKFLMEHPSYPKNVRTRLCDLFCVIVCGGRVRGRVCVCAPA